MSHKVKRDAFLYMEPDDKPDTHGPKDYAQCSTCMMWHTDKHNICHIHGKSVKVTGDMTCGLYVNGKPTDKMHEMAHAFVTPKQSGLLKDQVRCENCISYEAPINICQLYEELNERSDHFDLDPKVKHKGCCNAWYKKGAMDRLKDKAHMMEREEREHEEKEREMS